jgi:hypothetical protein
MPLGQVPDQDEHTELRTELAKAREEVLRLRDLLIANERELANYRGRVAEMDGGAEPLVMIAARLRTLLPGSLRAVLSRLLRRGRS